ncbi:uncharacterized protein MONOS_5278 [Monocercomonoides exilis]|uniref:uncharacterized protein n=1 Tax=Monocercomonoides exilis TaxID=2049356 RepID=UPI00355A2578|nr:hypothetical protein MONOS_5278 [Monocercomonoides exilis]|eukprot:MONOS_5278.1-p1 / transcript=MONOS_5278.1 / gene=MONOS_5278 / organism=Monocercomonoides_exilis_PA203 / gene_product=unspecified product / transcript_product=unspecified product / location=Mono_scaffold00152:3224-3928(-) / protein_length=235 / sequence_SO=supercontig / SO=protein_coding / is_pseudo=false
MRLPLPFLKTLSLLSHFYQTRLILLSQSASSSKVLSLAAQVPKSTLKSSQLSLIFYLANAISSLLSSCSSPSSLSSSFSSSSSSSSSSPPSLHARIPWLAAFTALFRRMFCRSKTNLVVDAQLLENTTALLNLLFQITARRIGTVTSCSSENEEIEEGVEEGEEEEEEEMFDKEAELGQDMSSNFYVTKKESVEGDDGVRVFGEVTTKTEVVGYRMCGRGEKEWMTIIDEAVSF